MALNTRACFWCLDMSTPPRLRASTFTSPSDLHCPVCQDHPFLTLCKDKHLLLQVPAQNPTFEMPLFIIPSLDPEDALEEDMATHSSVLVLRIPWAEEPGGLQSMGSQRVRHD